MTELTVVGEEALYSKVTGILDEARGRVARTVNTAMVEAYWRIGREIVEVEQRGKARAGYGEQLIVRLSKRLKADGAAGMSVFNLKYMRRFFLAFPQGTLSPDRRGLPNIGRTPSNQLAAAKSLKPEHDVRQVPSVEFHPALSWSHYLLLTRLANEQARAFYEIEAGREAWSVSQLERQIMSKLFERLARNGDAAALAARGQHVAKPEHVLKDPFVLEFLDLEENPATHERDLEQRIINRIESFMLELGKGFCFVGRQRRITLEGDHFYVDLVFTTDSCAATS